MIVTKIPKCCIFLMKTQHHIQVKPFYIRLGTCSKCSIVVPRTTQRVLFDSKLSSPVHQAKVFMVLQSDIYSLENLGLTYRRTEYATG